MKRYLLSSIIFLSSLLTAEQTITPYLTSENDTLSLVEGIVNAYNGKLVQIDGDVLIQGSDPLSLIRYYDGGHHYLSPYGYSVGFSFPVILAFTSHVSKKNLVLEQRTGNFIYFTVSKNKENQYSGKIDPDIFEFGYTNCCEALLRGEPDISAMSVSGNKEEFVVDLGNGGKRYYHYYKKTDSKVRVYRLVREERANGNKRYFSYYDSKSEFLKKVWTTNNDESIILNSLDFIRGADFYSIHGSNGQYVQYDCECKKAKGNIKIQDRKIKYEFRTYVLSGVRGNQILQTQYTPICRTDYLNSAFSTNSIKKPDGRSLDIEYDKNEKIKYLKISGISTPLYTFDYQKDKTIATDALGNQKTYEFSKQRLITLTEPNKIQKYDWSKTGQLLDHTITDSDGKVRSQRKYQYDQNGNVTETKVFGNIQNTCSKDCYTVRYVYSQDGRNNILAENHNHEREFTFTYLPGTNLPTRKLMFADHCFVEREFFQYDQNGMLIEKIKDDGSMPESNDLTNISYRLITRYAYQMNSQLPGMSLPVVIEEWFFDPKTNSEHLLKITEKTYTMGDHLAEEKVYDSNRNYCYTLQFSYNDNRELVSKTNPIGQKTIYRYDANGNKIFEETIGSNKKITFIYDLANRLIQEIEEHSDGTLLKTSHTYDAMNNKISTTNYFNQTTTYKYDSAGREISSIDPLGKSTIKKYDPEGNIINEIDKDGFVTQNTYNLYGKPLKISYPDGTSKQFAYNHQGYLVQEWEKDGQTTVYEVNYLGHPSDLKIYGPDGTLLKHIQKIYKGDHLLNEIDPMGNVTSYLYDGAGRKTKKIQGDQTTYYEYDHLGRLFKTITDDVVTLKIFDFLDRVVEERTEDTSGNCYKKSQFSYDQNGNKTLTKIFDQDGSSGVTKTIFNSMNQPTTIIDPLGNQTIIHYFLSDHLEKETVDPLGRIKRECYDKLERLSFVQHFSPERKLLFLQSFDYDGRGNRIMQHNRSLHEDLDFGIYEIRTSYDGMGQITSEVEQNEKVTTYTYQQGRLYQIIKPDGIVLTYHYDGVGLLKELTSSDGTVHYRYTYDLNDNLLKADDLIQNTITERGYDSLNRLIFERQATGLEIYYSYDLLNRLSKIQFEKNEIHYVYTPSGIESASRYKDGNLLYNFSQQINWTGKIISQTLPNGMTLSYLWDDANRCKKITSKCFEQSYFYDNAGNLISTTVKDPLSSYETNYFYNGINQLIQETGVFKNTYAFDSLNNRIKFNDTSYSNNRLNQLIDDSHDQYGYDKNGNRISKGDFKYSYDALGHLISAKSEMGTITYRYDPFGRMICRSDNAGTIEYLYQFDTEIGAFENGVMLEFRAIQGQFSPLAIELNQHVYYPIRNHRGDICVLVDEHGQIACTYRYDAFGNFDYQGSISSPWRFCGQRYDEGVSLYHFAKRSYDPKIGKWLTPDPLGFADGINLYAYVHNNPMNLVDPYGLWAEGLTSWYQHAKQFGHSFYRGFIDDTTWGASNYMLGDHNISSTMEKFGYYAGTGSSMAAGLVYGGTWLKGVRLGGKAALNGYKFLRGTNSASKVTSGVFEANNVVKLSQETMPLFHRISQVAINEKVIHVDKSVLKLLPDGHIWQIASPFKNKTANELEKMFLEKGFISFGKNPIIGQGSYVNPKNFRQYRIDPYHTGRYREPNHVDVSRPKNYTGSLEKRRFIYGDE
jgi:RHS repeat-associated protein